LTSAKIAVTPALPSASVITTISGTAGRFTSVRAA
jgi:hypothetical protein